MPPSPRGCVQLSRVDRQPLIQHPLPTRKPNIRVGLMESTKVCPRCTPGSSPLKNFAYSPLQERKAIRLLELEAGRFDDDIRCKVLRASLMAEQGSNPNYIALSYVWGPPEFEKFIRCCDESDESCHFHVTHNLHCALKTLRKESETRVFWIDQICINQANDEEKGFQVQLMKEIYTQATEVIAWLGEDGGHAGNAFRFARILLQTFDYAADMSENLKRELAEVPEADSKALYIIGMCEEEQSGWVGLQTFFLRPWFSRIWILQEAVFAKRLILQWGSEDLPWDVLLEVVERAESFDLVKVKLFRPNAFGVRASILAIRSLRSETVVPLQHLLKVSEGHRASNHRDRIFALLGLIKNSPSFGIVPRYDIPTYAVFRHATAAMIWKDKDLQVLAVFNKSPNNRLLELPTWSPDWSKSDLLLFERPIAGWAWFRSDRRQQANIRWNENPNLITLTGIVIDRITKNRIFFDPLLFDVDRFDDTNTDAFEISMMNHLRRVAQLLNDIKALYQSSSLGNESTTIAKESNWRLWRALVGGLARNATLATGQFSQYYQDYEKYIQHAVTVATSQETKEVYRGWSNERIRGCVDYSRALFEAGNQRQFTVTETGRLGWIPKWVETNDRVAIIHGSRLPVIIRPCQDNLWTWVSNCYIDGVMFGEAMDDERYTTEDITLC